TCAATRRAFQLAAVCDPVLDELGGKVVSAAAQQVFSGTVDYRIEPQELG
ncbi:DNA-directed RNA polymerase subunit omega, partial [Treponema pallidum]